ncbi:MAG: hypothetical protein LBP93_02455, partial [Treponema sp.]|nr:hypothetical protein [Treponema sp.]
MRRFVPLFRIGTKASTFTYTLLSVPPSSPHIRKDRAIFWRALYLFLYGCTFSGAHTMLPVFPKHAQCFACRFLAGRFLMFCPGRFFVQMWNYWYAASSVAKYFLFLYNEGPNIDAARRLHGQERED